MTNTLGKSRLVLIDSDALIGLIFEEDSLHERCLNVASFLSDNGYVTAVPYSIVLEAATTLAKDKMIKRPDLALKVLYDFSVSEQPYIDEEVAQIVAKAYDPKTSKQNSPFDYYLLSVALLNNINVVFSFDKFYKKQGLTLAEDLIK